MRTDRTLRRHMHKIAAKHNCTLRFRHLELSGAEANIVDRVITIDTRRITTRNRFLYLFFHELAHFWMKDNHIHEEYHTDQPIVNFVEKALEAELEADRIAKILAAQNGYKLRGKGDYETNPETSREFLAKYQEALCQ